MTQRRNRRSGVEDRWTKLVRDHDGNEARVHSAAHGKGKRWRARYVDDAGQEHAKGFTRKVDAQAWLDEVTAAQVTGSYVDPKRGAITFTAFYEQWSKRQVWVTGTMAAMDLAAKSVTFGHTPLVDLRPSHVESWVKAMQDKELEPSTIRTRFNNVRSVLRAAERDRLLPRDPAQNVKLPRVVRGESTMRIPTPAEVGQLMTSCTDHHAVLRAFVAVCAFAGLRLGEACGLRVSDVDFLRGEIRVERQSQKGEIRAPKYGSTRTVYVPKKVIAELAEHVRIHSPGTDPDRWLWSNTKGPWTADVVEPRFARLREKAGVSYKLHDLRHFYASGLIAAGCDVVTVQRAMGHKDATTTLNTYSHLWPKAEDRTRKASEKMFTESTADALRTDDGATGSDLV
ncbi:site-specific integrase [Gordonia polyisoprenivorans]|uniref:tyrosine-type recombinase/integrase n=1 Tax=Gordonia polyisoprenivorans TaxID=84595 RepID=UPI00223443D1|nr:site-specific integrase [Gordonia polyisoprenivorans]